MSRTTRSNKRRHLCHVEEAYDTARVQYTAQHERSIKCTHIKVCMTRGAGWGLYAGKENIQKGETITTYGGRLTDETAAAASTDQRWSVHVEGTHYRVDAEHVTQHATPADQWGSFCNGVATHPEANAKFTFVHPSRTTSTIPIIIVEAKRRIAANEPILIKYPDTHTRRGPLVQEPWVMPHNASPSVKRVCADLAANHANNLCVHVDRGNFLAPTALIAHHCRQGDAVCTQSPVDCSKCRRARTHRGYEIKRSGCPEGGLGLYISVNLALGILQHSNEAPSQDDGDNFLILLESGSGGVAVCDTKEDIPAKAAHYAIRVDPRPSSSETYSKVCVYPPDPDSILPMWMLANAISEEAHTDHTCPVLKTYFSMSSRGAPCLAVLPDQIDHLKSLKAASVEILVVYGAGQTGFTDTVKRFRIVTAYTPQTNVHSYQYSKKSPRHPHAVGTQVKLRIPEDNTNRFYAPHYDYSTKPCYTPIVIPHHELHMPGGTFTIRQLCRSINETGFEDHQTSLVLKARPATCSFGRTAALQRGELFSVVTEAKQAWVVVVHEKTLEATLFFMLHRKPAAKRKRGHQFFKVHAGQLQAPTRCHGSHFDSNRTLIVQHIAIVESHAPINNLIRTLGIHLPALPPRPNPSTHPCCPLNATCHACRIIHYSATACAQ